MKNNLADLNCHLFEMLERLEDDEIIEDEAKLKLELKRGKMICQVSGQILNTARLQVQALRLAEDTGLINEELPALIATKDSARMSERKFLEARR